MHRDLHSIRSTVTEARVLTLPAAHARCSLCWGQRAIWEPSVLGLVPVVCDGCCGTGRYAAGRRAA